jgi:hypothetical protein
MLLTKAQRYSIIGQSQKVLIKGPNMIKQETFLPPGLIAAFLMVHRQIKEENSLEK